MCRRNKLRNIVQILASLQLSMSIRRMQCSLFLLLLILAPALGEPLGLGLDGLATGMNYHVSALYTFYLRTKVWNSNIFSPQKHQKPEGRPLTVTGELNLRNIQEVDDSKMVISLEISLRYNFCPAVWSFNQPAGCTGMTRG